MRFADIGDDPFPRIYLTVLFIGAITVLDRFREKRQYLAQVRMDNNRLENLVMIACSPFGRFCFQTLGATDFIGRKILGAIDGNEIFPVKKPILGKLLTTLHLLQKGREWLPYCRGGLNIRAPSYLGLFRGRADAKDGGK